MAESKGVPTVPAAKGTELSVKDFQPKVVQEIAHYANILSLLRKVEGLTANEAEVYVQTKNYINGRIQMLHASESARIEAAKKVAESKGKDDTDTETKPAPEKETCKGKSKTGSTGK